MKEIEQLKDTAKDCMNAIQDKLNKLDEGITKVKTTRQEQTGKPYHQQ